MSTFERILFVCLLSFFLEYVLTDEIQAKPGDDVLLDCRDPSKGTFLQLRWIRPDLKNYYVYFLRESRSYARFQHPTFRGRVELRDPQMKDGDFSVILKHFGINDSGTYECQVGRNNTERDSKTIKVIHLTLEAVQKNITAEPGDNVTLCQVPQNIDSLVLECIRPDLEPEYIFKYISGQSDAGNQHPSFKNRVELKDSWMKGGNLSLILKNVTINDTGTYECHVYQSQRNNTISIITLNINTPGDEGREGNSDGHVGVNISVTLIVLLLVIVVVGVVLYRKYKGVQCVHLYTAPAEIYPDMSL